MILKKRPGVFFVAIRLLIACVAATAVAQTAGTRPLLIAADPALTARFTPIRPVLGRYEVSVDPRPVADVVTGPLEVLEAVDAFGTAGSYDRAALIRLYRGRRVQVSRSWAFHTDPARNGDFESLTFISPYPDPSLRQLFSGTLIIRWICDHRDVRCTAAL